MLSFVGTARYCYLRRMGRREPGFRCSAEEVNRCWQITDDAEGAGAPQGLSWSYGMDFGALIAAITGADPPDPDAPSADPRSVGPPAADPADEESVPAAPASSPAPGSAEEEAAQEASWMILLSWMPGLRRRAGQTAGGCRWRRWRGGSPSGWRRARTWPRGWPPPRPPVSMTVTWPRWRGRGGGWRRGRRPGNWPRSRRSPPAPRPAMRRPITGPDGRPSQVTPSAAAEVALELTMSPYGASAWADLAVQLAWRLAAHRRRAGRRDH